MYQFLGSCAERKEMVFKMADTRYLHVRDALMEKKVTLDGKPARICGRLKKFAIVWQREDICKQAEFSWPAVERIIHSGGNFLS